MSQTQLYMHINSTMKGTENFNNINLPRQEIFEFEDSHIYSEHT